MNIATNPIQKIATPPPIFGDSIEDTITADNAGAFEEILQKQFSIRNENALQSPSGLYGIPTGLDIQALGTEYNNVQNTVSNIQPIKETENIHRLNAENLEIKMPDIEIENKKDTHSQLFKFAQKHAASFYGKCSGNVILNLDEFVNDTIKQN